MSGILILYSKITIVTTYLDKRTGKIGDVSAYYLYD